jgi:pimeloyl-ACP methyl ester carboxylesterase
VLSKGVIVTEFLTHPQGGVIAYSRRGQVQNFPVFYLHGSPGSRLEPNVEVSCLADLGVQMITFDRPGYGQSDAISPWGLREAAAIVKALADHLGFEQFGLIAMSGGAPFMLASAAELSTRVRAGAILGGLGPIGRSGSLDGMSEQAQREFSVALNSPELLPQTISARPIGVALPAEEMEFISKNPDLLDMLLASYPEASRQGHAGIVADFLAFVSPWDFDLESITAPIHLWHGRDDKIVPYHHATFIASSVPGAALTTCAEAGHFDMFDRVEGAIKYVRDGIVGRP